MAVNFDQNDMTCWYFGGLSRADATQMLMNERESGVFLVRDSNTIQGDYVLCVREDGRVSHYIINKVVQPDSTTRYRIGDQIFPDLPTLLGFYRLHYLDTTPLIRPLVYSAPPVPVLETVLAKFDFEGTDTDDLPFRRGEVLEIISRDEEQWWTARNRAGNTGSIPVPYVTRYVETNANNSNNTGTTERNSVPPPNNANQDDQQNNKTNMQRTLPAFARVRQSRVPNAYDKTALRLERGDIVKVTKTNINGQWEGELNGKRGHFPFTHVEFLDEPVPLNQVSDVSHAGNGS
ncbi:crk proto-oncogene, adaptor protein [Arctopsyche grandis]|uniref:crk proto-oncogene, adaptor protein n=1 Tax=Arctopsyche grandis TaxID=121162 RepID=UPI00406D6384